MAFPTAVRSSAWAAGRCSAFGQHDAARVAFEGLSFSHRREYVRSITEAKRADTRARRVERTIRALLERAPGG
jgi:uncharacterized protein YdeI (YjbR/CyaY-like superfamily)